MVERTTETRAPIVATTDGPVVGLIRDGMKQYLGIPYAAPPVGELRWRPPVAPTAWTKPYEAVAYGPVCAQDTGCVPGFGFFSEEEDCLYMNVVTPADMAVGEKLPVMIWIPGGGLFLGGSTGYDPSALVRDGRVIFVSMNYRINVFGFFSHPAINAEGHAAGNYGLMDQQFCFSWVQRNISNFGGDPDNVTIFGESAGGISVLAQLASPGAAGLFHKAILQSCSVAATTSTQTLASVESVGVGLATAAGCTDQTPANLRAISTKDLMKANSVPKGEFSVGPYYIGLVADGVVIPAPMRTLFEEGRIHRVPVINGVNHDEFTWFQGMVELATGNSVTPDIYPHVVGPVLEVAQAAVILGAKVPAENLPEVLSRYPVEAYGGNANLALSAAVGDCGLICNGGRRTARLIGRWAPVVYTYEFDVPEAPAPWPEVSFSYRSGHTQELQFIFPLFHGGGGTPHELTAPQKRLATQMVEYWTNFAHTGSPNSDSPHLPNWPVYDAKRDCFLSLRIPDPVVIESFGETHNCDFWDQFYG